MTNKVVGYRTMLGMTQKEIAEYFGISPQAYWKKEVGKVPFSDKKKVIFKNLLKPIFPSITIDEIFFSKIQRNTKK